MLPYEVVVEVKQIAEEMVADDPNSVGERWWRSVHGRGRKEWETLISSRKIIYS